MRRTAREYSNALMLIDQRGTFAVVPIRVIGFLRAAPHVRRELITGVPPIMSVTVAQFGAVAGGQLREQVTG